MPKHLAPVNHLEDRPYVSLVGATAKDTATGKIGVVAAHEEGLFTFTPFDGGEPWQVRAEVVRMATREEIMRARVSVENARSRGELPLGLEPAVVKRVTA